MTGDIPVIWRHFLLDISHIFYAKRVAHCLKSRDYKRVDQLWRLPWTKNVPLKVTANVNSLA